MTEFDYEAAFAGLTLLNRAVRVFDHRYPGQIEEFIDVGEYSLALDDIAGCYLNNDVPMPPDLFDVFERLAVMMDVNNDEYCERAAKLLAIGRTRSA